MHNKDNKTEYWPREIWGSTATLGSMAWEDLSEDIDLKIGQLCKDTGEESSRQEGR